MTGIEARILLPLKQWPEADVGAWRGLFREGDILEGRGAAWHWAEATRRTNAKHYARWLGWLAATDRLDTDTAPCDRLTPEVVRAFGRSMIDVVAPRTVASTLIGLKCVVKRMRPDRDWRWLMDITNRLDSWAMPSVDRSDRILPAPYVFDGALAELAQLAARRPMSRREQIAFRDALIVALLTACPIRLRNLAQIRIGTHLRRDGGVWSLAFAADETKTGQPLLYLLPTALMPWLEYFLAEVRPGFRIAPGCDHLWPGSKANPMAYETLYMRVSLATERLFGVAINPHSFRCIAATSLAERSPDDALFARPLLGHRLPATTERHYIKANQIEASRRVNDMLIAVRGTPSRRRAS